MLAANAAFAYDYYDDDYTYSDDDFDYSYYSSCCCAPAFVLLAGAALFTWAHRK